MKKILAIAVAFIMVMALSVSVFATKLDLDNTYAGSDVTTGSNDELIGIMFPDGLTYNTGDKVTVHFVGNSTGDFRVWLSHADGFVTMTPEPIWKASEKGFTTGAFDFTVELEVGDKDGTGQTIADSIIFKGPSYGTNLDNFSLSLVEIVDGKDDAPAEPVAAPETNDAPAAAPESNDAPTAAPETSAPATAPKTGVTLAIVPAIIALAAATVTKRR